MNVGAGIDPAFRSDTFAGVIVRERKGIFYVVEVFERRPAKGAPLVPSVVTREFCQLAKRHGARAVATDQFYVESVKEHVRAAGLTMYEAPTHTQAGKARLAMVARELVHSQRVRIPTGQRGLIQQLREVITTPTSGGGVSVQSPRRGGGHGDLASAFILSLWRCQVVARASASTGRVIIAGGASSRQDPMFAGGGFAASSEWVRTARGWSREW